MILNIDHEKQHAKGSARSISQISMFELLSTQADLIDKFGGHHAAAGLTLPIENVESLKQALNEVMKINIKKMHFNLKNISMRQLRLILSL